MIGYGALGGNASKRRGGVFDGRADTRTHKHKQLKPLHCHSVYVHGKRAPHAGRRHKRETITTRARKKQRGHTDVTMQQKNKGHRNVQARSRRRHCDVQQLNAAKRESTRGLIRTRKANKVEFAHHSQTIIYNERTVANDKRAGKALSTTCRRILYLQTTGNGGEQCIGLNGFRGAKRREIREGESSRE